MANNLPIHLGLSAELFGSADSAAKLSEDEKAEILARDNHTCQCCGFKADQYQEVMTDPRSIKPGKSGKPSYVTVCVFCHQCFNMDKVAEMSSGTLIWLPEVSQADLHHLARAIYVARITQGSMADAGRRAFDLMMERRQEAANRIKTDDPAILTTVYRDYLSKRYYEDRARKLEGVRLFPLDRRMLSEGDLKFNKFPQILAYWRSKKGPFGEMLPNSWLENYKNLSAA